MGWLILILLLGYLIVASITAKRYYLRRHGVLPRQGEPGLSWAGQIGLAWPVTIFLRSVQKPNQCNHPRHNPHPLARPSTTAMSYPHPPIKQPAMRDLNELFPDAPADQRMSRPPPPTSRERPMRNLDEVFPDRSSGHRTIPAPHAPAGERPMRDLDRFFSHEPGDTSPPQSRETPVPATPRDTGVRMIAMIEEAQMRPDIQNALDELPPNMKQEALTSCSQSLEFLNTNLNPDETVRHISPAATQKDAPTSCLLVVTGKRLIFVAPRPQAVAWQLSSVTRHQSTMGYFFIEGDAREYSLGLDPAWGAKFENQVARAVATSVLAGL